MENQDELDRVAFDAFLLAMRVMYLAYELDEPATRFEAPFEMLRDLSTGKLILSSPAELGVRFPHMKELVYDTANTIIENDRETASRVLRGLGLNFGSMGS